MRKLLLALAAAAALAWPAAAQVSTSQVSVTPASAAYSAAQCIGGVLTVPDMVRTGRFVSGAIIVDVDIVDTSATNATIDLLVFSQAPTGTYTDRTACVVAAADQAFLQGAIFGSSFTCAVDSGSATGICRATPALAITQKSSTNNALWFLPIMRSTPTYGTGKTLFFNITAVPQ